MSDLFSYRPPRYPTGASYKAEGPSKHAATAVTGSASRLRAQVLLLIEQHPGGMSADEIAATLNRSVLSVRPRVSELHLRGAIEQTGERRRNASGMTATVWRKIRPITLIPGSNT